MRHSSPQPIWLTLGSSRHMVAYLLVIHSAAVLAIVVLTQGLAWKVAASITVLVSLGYYLSRDGLRLTTDAVTRAHWRSDGQWWLTDGAGEVSVYTSAVPYLLHPAMTIVKLTGKDGVRWLLMPGDCADADVLRRLRVRLQQMRSETAQERPLRGT